MKTIVFLLEEPSAKEMIETILQKLFPDGSIEHRCISFEGKRDLENQLVRKIRFWNKPNTCFLIMRDQDSEDCRSVKENLKQLVLQTGKEAFCIIRIACHELESFFLGDLEAVEQGLGLEGVSKHQNNKKYRNPDNLANAAEEMKRLNQGHYAKVSWRKTNQSLFKTGWQQSFREL